MKLKKVYWFTLVELIIAITIFSVFVLMASTAFSNSLSTIQYIKIFAEEQESMLYDNFMLDETISNSNKIYELKPISSYATWYLFELNRGNNKYPFATLDINYITWSTLNHYLFWIKKFIPLNDISLNPSWNIIFSSPWDGDIKNFSNWSTILSNTWILNNPTWLLLTWSELYISDTWNSCIRKLSNINSCFIWKSWTPWTDSTTFISPTFLALTWNTLYISDTYNNKIRKVSLSNTWNISDFYWNWTFWNNIYLTWTKNNLSLPTWIAIYNNFLYVSDTGNNRIIKIDLLTWSWVNFIWNWKDDTIWVNSWTKNPESIPISQPTTLKISWSDLYFVESLNWVIKKVSLIDWKIDNVLWVNKNITYFWDFEDDLSNLWSYNISNLSWSITWEPNYIPYSWKKLLFLNNNSFSNWSFTYNFSWITISKFEKLDSTVYIKSLSWSYDFKYWLTSSNNYIWNYLTWKISDSWSKFYFNKSNLPDNQIIDWLRIEISWWLWNSWSFLIDWLKFNFKNLNITWNNNRFENYFPYIWWLYINSNNIWFSTLINWENYFSSSISSITKTWSLYNWINFKNNNYLFDDYKSKTKLSNIYTSEINYINSNSWWIIRSILWYKIDFKTLNWYFLSKYIWIKN